MCRKSIEGVVPSICLKDNREIGLESSLQINRKASVHRESCGDADFHIKKE